MSRILLVASLLATTACGKKGPPLAPFVRIPSTPEIAGARRVGNEMYVSIKLPTTNIDGSAPASLAQIEVYAVTALTPPPRAQFLSMATRVAIVPVARAADPADKSGTVVPDPATGALQGSTVIVRDSLSAAAMEPKPMPAPPTPRPTTTAVVSEPVPQVLRRFYLTVAFSDRRRSSAPSMLFEAPLGLLPERVPTVRAVLMGERLALEWDPSGGLLGWLLERALPAEASAAEEQVKSTAAAQAPTTELPAGPTTYNVYRETAPDPLALPEPAVEVSDWTNVPRQPINMAPLSALMFNEELRLDERRRCYRVAAVRGSGAGRVESEMSDAVCIVAVDVEPPMAVTGLSALPMEGEIRLTWEPNGEEDLRGYLVLRGEAGGDTLQPLNNSAPVSDTRYTDNTVTSGRMYTYVVRAVDNRIPLANVSDPAEVTVTAR